MKKWIIFLSMLIPLSLYASVPLSDEKALSRSNTSALADGFYHIMNAGTGRYMSFNDTDPSNYQVSQSGSVNLAGIRTYINYDSVAVSPSCVIYVKNLGDGKYDLAAQGSSLDAMMGGKITLEITTNDDGTYKIQGTYNGLTKYLTDKSPSKQDGNLVYAESGMTNWTFKPIDTSNEYIGIRPDVKTVDGTYYGTVFAGFNFKLVSPGMSAYYVGNAGGTGFEMKQIDSDIIPANTPIIIRCNSANPLDNKIEPVIGSYVFNNINWLGGVYCSIYVTGHHNVIRFDDIKMRILGLSDKGELAFVANPPISRLYKEQYLMTNKAYLKVNSGDADVMTDVNAAPSDDKVTLVITSSGNGSALYEGATVRDKSSSFSVNKGTNVTITFAPDNGYKVKSVKVNSTDVTSQIYNNSYTISNVTAYTTVDVEFEAITTTTYNLTIKASGNGSVTYDGTVIREKSNSFTVNEGANATVSFSPDNGYRIKNVQVNGSDVSLNGSNNQYTISNIQRNTTLDVYFEAIPPKTYTLTITASGSGSATFDGNTVRDKSSSFSVNEGTNATITFNPDNGYRIKSVKLNSTDVTSSVSNNRYTVSNIKANTDVDVVFEVIPPTTYTLTITSSGNGSASYDGTTVRDKTSSFSVNEGSNATITFTPDNGCRIKSVKVNGSDVTTKVSNNSYIISNISGDTTIEVEFENDDDPGEVEPDQPGQIHIDDIFYKVTESGEAEVVSVEEGETSVTIPSTISYNNNTYKVTSIAKEVFENREHLAAVIWEPESQFNSKVNNPNFLLYVSDEKYASHTVKNVVVNGVAENIELTDAANGNDFYCPKAFKAKSIIYSHNFQMETGLGDSRGWETIVLPFDVQKYTHATKGDLESFTTWSKSSSKKPFWLFELTASGYKDVADIKANTPYIISMPNNQQYEQQYQIPGIVTFSASDVEVQKSDNLIPASYQGRTFVPNYTNQNNLDFLALNVSNNYVTNPSKEIAGSKFIRGLRAVHPFEAYMTTTDNTRSIDVMDGMPTSIKGVRMDSDEKSSMKVYDIRGRQMSVSTESLKPGIYIVNGKKMIIKK